jgi:glycosyltransferase involved in cell wall biosynthesis
MWCRLLAHLGSVSVLTRADNRGAIEEQLPGLPEHDRLRFVYYQLPLAEGRWAADGRGKRAYYLLWQRGALREARRLQTDIGFDLVWHLTWSNAWVGSVLALLDRPFVWGPLGGGIAPPLGLVPSLGAKGAVYEGARAVVRLAGRYANPLARASWRKAALILVSNDDTERWLPKRHRAKVTVMPQYGLTDRRGVTTRSGGQNRSSSIPLATQKGIRTALFIGRLLAFKGGSLVLRAVAASPEWQLVICGSGPDQARLQRLAKRLGIQNRVFFAGWVPRSQIASLMAESDALLFPSLHDESPATVLEARENGLPVICLDRGGAAVLAGEGALVVPAAGGSRAVIRRLIAALEQIDLYPVSSAADLDAMSLAARAQVLRPRLERLLANGPRNG